MKHTYLFILCPPASGSTLLWRILQTSPHVSAFRLEGQALAKEYLFTPDRWDPEKKIPWDQVKRKWQAAWDVSKPILLEKSPPHLVRARQIEEHFPDSRFIVMVRNPYAFCEGLRRRWLKKTDLGELARNWVRWAGHQSVNRRTLACSVFFTYEDLCDRPRETCVRLIRFLPELEALSFENEFKIFERSQPVENLNERQIARLSAADLREINAVLAEHRPLLAEFGYGLLGEGHA